MNLTGHLLSEYVIFRELQRLGNEDAAKHAKEVYESVPKHDLLLSLDDFSKKHLGWDGKS